MQKDRKYVEGNKIKKTKLTDELKKYYSRLSETIFGKIKKTRQISGGKYKKLKRITISVSMVCNFHCKYCSVFDFEKTKPDYKFIDEEDVRLILDGLKSSSFKPDVVTLAGAEPLLNPNIDKIVDLMISYKFKRIEIISNATVLTKKNIKVLKKVTDIEFSIYPHSRKIYDKLKSSTLLKELQKSADVHFRMIEDFWNYNELCFFDDPQANYNKCIMKDQCMVATKEGLYRCWILFILGEDVCPYEKEKMTMYLNKKTPFDKCSTCSHWIGEKYAHKTLKQNEDSRIVDKGIKFINEF